MSSSRQTHRLPRPPAPALRKGALCVYTALKQLFHEKENLLITFLMFSKRMFGI